MLLTLPQDSPAVLVEPQPMVPGFRRRLGCTFTFDRSTDSESTTTATETDKVPATAPPLRESLHDLRARRSSCRRQI